MDLRSVLACELAKLMRVDDKICILDADLSKPNGTSPLYKEFPDRCFNCGIAEANMASVASGLSSYGYKPIIVSFAPFVTRRIFDQIVVSIAYAKQNVKIIGTDPGLTAEINGGTHMTFADIALMRTIPNMMVYDCVDEIQLSQAVSQIVNYNGNVYIRMPRKSTPIVFNESYKLTLGKSDVVVKGTDITVIASGVEVKPAYDAVEEVKSEGINAELISINTIKPLDYDTLLTSIKKTNHIVVCENHNVIGGVFGAISEMCALNHPTHITPVAIMDEFGQVGKFNELANVYHITKDDIVTAIKKELNK